MTFIWLVCWIVSSAPTVELLGSWNTWGVAFAASLGIDVVSAMTWLRRGKHRRYLHAFGRTYVPGRGWARGEPDEDLRRAWGHSAEHGGRAIGDAQLGQPAAEERV